MSTPAAGRGGTPPRPAGPPALPAQWFIFGPWLYDVQMAMQPRHVASDAIFGALV